MKEISFKKGNYFMHEDLAVKKLSFFSALFPFFPGVSWIQSAAADLSSPLQGSKCNLGCYVNNNSWRITQQKKKDK